MILYGASGHAKVIMDILKNAGINVSEILDDNVEVSSLNERVVNHPSKFKNTEEPFIISIGHNETRKMVVGRNSFDYGIAIHPKSIIDKTTKIDAGSVVMAGAIINADSKIGKHCIINTGASIDHDCVLEDFVHISPKATLCGGIKIGEGTQIGAGAVIVPNLNIGKWCTIGAGAVVISDVPDHTAMVGNPARIIHSK